jgi:hypothetical protein
MLAADDEIVITLRDVAAMGQVGGVLSARRRLNRAGSTNAMQGSRAEHAVAGANDAAAGRRRRVPVLDAREQRRERTAHETHLAAIAARPGPTAPAHTRREPPPRIPADVKGRAQSAAASREAARADAITMARIQEQARTQQARAEAERRLALGRRVVDDRQRHGRRVARAVAVENERLSRALGKVKPHFATAEQIDALHGRL